MSTERQVNRFNRFIGDLLGVCYDDIDLERLTRDYILYMLSRTQSMFKWEGLPDTIPARMLEMYLQMNGCCAFYKHDGSLYVYTGGRGGEPDVYYQPTIFTIANPAQNLSINAIIDRDCVVMPNDCFYMGLLPLFKRYGRNMADVEISLKTATINTRIVSLISASDDKTRLSAEKFIEDIKTGKLSIVAETQFFEGLKVSPYANSSAVGAITDLIELMQYNKASAFNDIGLNANYNMKRESINSGESQLNNDALFPLVDNMLSCRQIAAEKVNAMFGTNITVSLNSSWEDNKKEVAAEIENINEGGEIDNEGLETVNENNPDGQNG